MSKKTTIKEKKAKKEKKYYDSSPRTNEKEVGKSRIDNTVKERTFEYYNKPTLGDEFFIFRKLEDEITGQICGHAISNIHRNSSYPLKLESGRVVEFFANKQLHGIIRDYELIFSWVRIVYIGRNHQGWGGHAAKVYRVYKINRATGHENGPLVQHLKSLKKKRSKKDGQ